MTIKGIYGREMYETWYKMTVMLECGLDISPVTTHRLSYRDYEQRSRLPSPVLCARVSGDRSCVSPLGERTVILHDMNSWIGSLLLVPSLAG